MFSTIDKLLLWIGLTIVAVVFFTTPIWSQDAPQTREYWIKAEEIFWDYAPSFPNNPMMAKPLDENQMFSLLLMRIAASIQKPILTTSSKGELTRMTKTLLRVI